MTLKADAIAAFQIQVPERRMYDLMFARRLATWMGAMTDSKSARRAPRMRIREAKGISTPRNPRRPSGSIIRGNHPSGTSQTQRAIGFHRKEKVKRVNRPKRHMNHPSLATACRLL